MIWFTLRCPIKGATHRNICRKKAHPTSFRRYAAGMWGRYFFYKYSAALRLKINNLKLHQFRTYQPCLKKGGKATINFSNKIHIIGDKPLHISL